MFSLSGDVAILPESKMNAVIAVNGSSPAYVYLFAKAMLDYAVSVGIDREAALSLICKTFEGSAEMLRSSGDTAHREPEKNESEQPPRRNRRGRGRRPDAGEKPRQQEKPAKAQEKPAKAQEKPAKSGKGKERARDEKHPAQKPPREEGAKKPGRRRHYRRREGGKPEQK